jgi:hypothetical protein
MSAIASAAAFGRVDRGERVSWLRLLWVAPLTVVAAVAGCYLVRTLVLLIDPSLSRMSQLGQPMITLTIEGAISASVVFGLFALLVPRPLFWYRRLGIVALVLSWAPDIALGIGGAPMQLAMRYVGPLASIGRSGGGGPPPGGATQTGGPPPGFFSAMPLEQVVVLMLLHATVAVVCVVLLTTLTRARGLREQGKQTVSR